MRHRAASPAVPGSPARTGRDRLPSLTGLRFWAALVVVLYHLSRQVAPLPGLSDMVWYGRSGVTFFFVLSGFVLAWTYDGARVPATVFLWRRFARIWPLLAVTTVFSVGVWLALGKAVSAKAVVATLLLVHAWIPDPVILQGGNPAAWSLSDEAWFYLIFPALMALPAVRSARGRRWIGVLACGGALLVWLGGSLLTDASVRAWALDYLPLTRTLQFLLGVVAGLAVKRGWRPPVSLWPAVALVIGWHAALIPWSGAVPDSLWYSPYSASQLLSAPLFALLVAAAAVADVEGRATGLGGPWAIRLGHWSFAWYLIHEIVIRFCLAEYSRPESVSSTALLWALVIAVSLLLSACAYIWVEHPLERLLRAKGPRVPAPPRRDDPASPGAPRTLSRRSGAGS
ncbi:hypothetical protein SUDANB132_02637 [Streptomyces sp. enrichment culture]